MLKRRPGMKIILFAALAAGLYGCSNGNGEVSAVNNGHGAYAPGAFASATVHGPLAKSILTTCQACHATPANGSNPRFNVTHMNIPTGCETCHETLTAHPTPWLPNRLGTPFNVANATSHATATNVGTTCTPCHGMALDGVDGVAPSCMSGSVGGISCHVSDPSQQPTGCTSCHRGSPVGPDGLTAPNRVYAHTKHIQLGLSCDICHSGSGYGTASHADGIHDVLINATYQAKSMTLSYSGAGSTCSGVSCHGGKTTPAWQQAITACTDCHESGTALGAPQNNSYYSGKHQSHLTGGANNVYRLTHPADIACTDCHSASKLTATMHFGGLATAAFTNPPRDTIGGTDTKLTTADYVAPNTTSCATSSCHASGRRDWNE